MHEAMSVINKDKQIITGIIRNNHQSGKEMFADNAVLFGQKECVLHRHVTDFVQIYELSLSREESYVVRWKEAHPIIFQIENTV